MKHSSVIHYYRGKELALPDVSYYLSHGRYVIHVCVVRKDLYREEKEGSENTFVTLHHEMSRIVPSRLLQ